MAVGERVLGVQRPPEVHDLAGVVADAVQVQVHEPGVLADDQSDGARALGGFAGRADAVTRDVRGDDQRLAAARPARRDPVRRRADAGHAAEAGVLGLEGAAVARQAEDLVYVDGHGLGVVDAGLGADDQGADVVRIDVEAGERQARPHEDVLVVDRGGGPW